MLLSSVSIACSDRENGPETHHGGNLIARQPCRDELTHNTLDTDAGRPKIFGTSRADDHSIFGLAPFPRADVKPHHVAAAGRKKTLERRVEFFLLLPRESVGTAGDNDDQEEDLRKTESPQDIHFRSTIFRVDTFPDCTSLA